MQAWALLVGIERYQYDLVEPVPGALHDVANIEDYLVNDLGVPPAHIMILRNAEATRANILSAFWSHIIDNPAIGNGDPIIFHFSGHGTRGPAPSSWPMAWTDREEADRLLEMIVCYDSVGDPRWGRHGRTSGIPDRTLGALLRKAAEKHGRNITVIFDCCNSGHGTRNVSGAKGKYRKRSVDPVYVGALDDSDDQEIWNGDAPSGVRGSYLRGAFVDRNEDTHVLLAACGRYEDCNGSPEGGFFTLALLDALRNPDIVPRTYSEILKAVQYTLHGWFEQMRDTVPLSDRPNPQHPQCEGVNRDRILFENMAVDPARFAVQPCAESQALCIIEAGEVHGGICPGAQFELRQFACTQEGYGREVVLGTAIAVEVFTARCVAQLPYGVIIPPHGVRAFLTHLPNPLRFIIINDMPHSAEAAQAMQNLESNLYHMSSETAAFCTRVHRINDAELVIRVTDQHVYFERKDLQTSYLDIQPPPLKVQDINMIFPSCMALFAKFNHHLSQTSPLHPFANDIDLHLHRLIPQNGADFAEEDEYMFPGPVVPFVNAEATVPYEEDAIYGIVLRNNTNYDLYPYAWYHFFLCLDANLPYRYIFFFDPGERHDRCTAHPNYYSLLLVIFQGHVQ